MPQAKISELSKKIAKEIVAETGEKQIDIIEKALIKYRQIWRMEKLNRAYSKLEEQETIASNK